MFVIEKTVEIKAPAAVVWEVIRDLSKYPEWNPFCIECRSTLQPGDPIDMKVKLMAKPQPQREWVKEYVEGRRFAYAMKQAPLGALSSFRSHDVEAIEYRKSTRLNSSHYCAYRMTSSALKKITTTSINKYSFF